MWYPIVEHIDSLIQKGEVDMRAYYFFMKFLRGLGIGFITAVPLFGIVAAVWLLLLEHCL